MSDTDKSADALTNHPSEVEECREALRGDGFTPVLPELQERHATVSDPVIPAELHHDTAKLVRRFARALANKLLAAQRKYGYSDNWMRDDWADECRAELMRHIQKGDPRDVAAYCAFLWHHNESTAPAQDSDVLTDEQREDLLKLEAAATPMPWRYQENSDVYTHIVRSDANPGMIVAYGPQSSSGQVEADARFIAAIRNAAPALLALRPVEQHEAAPAEDHECVYENGDGICRACAELAKRAKHETAPADAVTANDRELLIGMIDAAMEEMKNIDPPLSRPDCKRLIYAAVLACNHAVLSGQPTPPAPLEGTGNGADERAFPATDGYFVYDRAGGHVEFYDTDAERDAAHREAIAEYRRDAMHDQEWPTEVEGIVSGVVTHTAGELEVHEDSYEFEPCAVTTLSRAPRTEVVGAVQEGWKLVPIKPTGVMKDAGHWALPVGVGGPWTAAAVYQAMLDQVTTPPSADAAAAPADWQRAIPQIPDLVKSMAWLTMCLRTELSRLDDTTHKALDEVEAQLCCVRAITNGAIDYEAVVACAAASQPAAAAGQEAVAHMRISMRHGEHEISLSPEAGALDLPAGEYLLCIAPPAQVATQIDIETMLRACVPGGDIVDPQLVCDNIREWVAEHGAQVATRRGLTEIEYEKVRLGLHAAKHFIANGIELGFIRMPDADCPDPAHNTPKLVDEALALLEGDKQ
ncbi:hypothetical protein LGN29_39395 [Burkholderia cepacia]|nr:hypothetical protein [Burkholderia cepacia]MCA8326236.1 hypothetical protein [Burkholderia cepacia]